MVEFYIPLLEGLFIFALILEALSLAKSKFIEVEAFIESLGPHFVTGALLGTFSMMCFIVRLQGLYAPIKADGQVHYVTLMWLNLIALYIFHKSDKPTVLKKAIFAFFFTFLVYLIHDFFWITKSYWMGIQLTVDAERIYPSIGYYLGSYSRFFTLTVLSIWHLSKNLKLSKLFLLFFTVQAVYHVSVIVFTSSLSQFMGLPNDTILGLVVDSLPYLFILKKKKKEGIG